MSTISSPSNGKEIVALIEVHAPNRDGEDDVHRAQRFANEVGGQRLTATRAEGNVWAVRADCYGTFVDFCYSLRVHGVAWQSHEGDASASSPTGTVEAQCAVPHSSFRAA